MLRSGERSAGKMIVGWFRSGIYLVELVLGEGGQRLVVFLVDMNLTLLFSHHFAYALPVSTNT